MGYESHAAIEDMKWHVMVSITLVEEEKSCSQFNRNHQVSIIITTMMIMIKIQAIRILNVQDISELQAPVYCMVGFSKNQLIDHGILKILEENITKYSQGEMKGWN
jgi:hypothetical protein